MRRLARATKAAVWAAFMRLGLEIHVRKDPLRFLARMNIRTVIDVGANEGQFARNIRDLLPHAKIYSFEPLPVPFSKLENAFSTDLNFEAVPLALGSIPGDAEFESNAFSPSSSFLPVNDKHRKNYPHAAQTSRTKVPVSTLDLWARDHILEPNLLIKMDVQGYEDQVILGASETLSKAAVVIAETSFAPLYQGQPLYDDIYRLLRNRGFRSGGMIVNATDRETGEMLQADSVFIRDPIGR